MIYQFTHPTRGIVYRWNLEEGLIYFDGDNPKNLHPRTNKGHLLLHLIENQNLSTSDQKFRFSVRSELSNLCKLLEITKDREHFIKTIKGFGYRWLIEVEREDGDSKPLHLRPRAREPKKHQLEDHVIDFSRLIRQKTRDFVGRDFIKKEVKNFLNSQDRGYFVIEGDPGIGKTSLIADLSRTLPAFSYFNIRKEGIQSPARFLRHICAAMIMEFSLSHDHLPTDVATDSAFLKRILSEVSDLTQGKPLIILIDALDEVALENQSANILYLPSTLPKNLYVICSSRRKKHLPLQTNPPPIIKTIIHDSEENLQDIKRYLSLHATKPKIRSYIASQSSDAGQFIQEMKRKSEGNFMYLHYVIEEITDGAYQDRQMKDLPQGLRAYYEDHWMRMRGQAKCEWFDLKLPIVQALTAVGEPVSLALLSQFSGVRDRRKILDVIWQFWQFIHCSDFEHPETGTGEIRYRIYHSSYEDFIQNKDEVQAEKERRGELTRRDREIDLTAMREKISALLIDSLIEQGFLEENFVHQPGESKVD